MSIGEQMSKGRTPRWMRSQMSALSQGEGTNGDASTHKASGRHGWRRARLLGLLALRSCPVAGAAAEASYHAGFLALTVPGDRPFPVGVWYPTGADESPWRSGVYELTTARDAPLACAALPRDMRN